MAERIDRTTQASPATIRPLGRERISELNPSMPANPPVFRAWVANRLLGENLRAALSPTFERSQKAEPTPFVRYLDQTREALKTIKARPEKEIVVQIPRRAELAPVTPAETMALRETIKAGGLNSSDPVKLKLQLNPKLDAQRAVGRFKAEVDSLVPLSLAAPKLAEVVNAKVLEIRPTLSEVKTSPFKSLPSELKALDGKLPDLKLAQPEARATQAPIVRQLDTKPFDVRPMLPEIKTILTRFEIKSALPEIKTQAPRLMETKPLDIRPVLPEIKTNLARFDFKAQPVLPEIRATQLATPRLADARAFDIRPLLPEIKTNLTRFDFKAQPVLPEIRATQLVTPRLADARAFDIRPLLPEIKTNLTRFDFKAQPVLPEIRATQLATPRLADARAFDIRPLLPEIKTNLARFDFKAQPVLPEVRATQLATPRLADARAVDLRPILAEIKTNLTRFDFKAQPVLPEIRATQLATPRLADARAFDIRPLLPEIKTNLTRFDFKAQPVLPEVRATQLATPRLADARAVDLRPILAEMKTNLTRFDQKPAGQFSQPAVESKPGLVPRPQNALREIFSSNEARPTLRIAQNNLLKPATLPPQIPVLQATPTSTRPPLLRLEPGSAGLIKQVATSNEARPAVQNVTSSPARPQALTTTLPAQGSNNARLTFSSPTTIRGDLTEKAPLQGAVMKLTPKVSSTPGATPLSTEAAAEPAVSARPGPKPAASPPLKTAGIPVTASVSPDKQKVEKHETEDVSARPVALEQKLRTSSSEPLRSLAAKATRQVLEGKEEPESSTDLPAYAIAPIQGLQREEKPDEKPAPKEEKESGRNLLSGGMGSQAPIAPLQSFHQDERYGGSSPTFAPPRRDGGAERKPPEAPQARPQGEEAAAVKAREAVQGAQLTSGQVAQQQTLSQKQQDQEKRTERNHEEAHDSEGVEAKKESLGGSSKSGRGTESDQARRQQAQVQRQQQNAGKSSSSGRPRYITRPQDLDEPDDIATSEDNGLNCCGKCGYILGGSADLACPVCTSEQPDLALRIFTQYRQQGAHWITCADTLAVTEDARHSLAEMATTAVYLHFVPKIPKYSQILKLNQNKKGAR